MKKRYALAGLLGVLILGGFFYLGYILGTGKGARANQAAAAGITSQADFTPFWKAWQVLNERSIYRDKVTPQQEVWGAIEGLASSFGDPYTTFFDPDESKRFESEIRGDFGGLGIEVGVRNHALTVIAPLPNTPAMKAGIKSGDVITAVDGEPTSQMTVDEAVSKIRGKIGTTVTLSVLHRGEKTSTDVAVMRAKIDIPTVKTDLLANGIFEIELYSFTSKSPDLFKQALRQFKESGNHKLILDLRGNPGGYLEAAVDMASYFLPLGKVVVKEESGGNIDHVYRSKGYDIFPNDLDMVILVDGGTASAAEILSGALKQQGVATLVGEQTFGKGSVQELIPITTDTSLKVTIAEWLTPDGTSISKDGLTPDIVVDATSSDFLMRKDPQLQKAIEVLSK